jgi:PIN domain nuclease of toxin-antitoxin system
VRILLDTQIVLWTLENHPQLSARARTLLTDPEHTFYVSSISVWEIVIKHSLGKLPLKIAISELLGFVQASGFQPLEFSAAHAVQVSSLLPIHADPFDRALLAQAFLEPMHLLTHDEQMVKYGGTVIFV